MSEEGMRIEPKFDILKIAVGQIQKENNADKTSGVIFNSLLYRTFPDLTETVHRHRTLFPRLLEAVIGPRSPVWISGTPH